MTEFQYPRSTNTLRVQHQVSTVDPDYEWKVYSSVGWCVGLAKTEEGANKLAADMIAFRVHGSALHPAVSDQ